MSRSIFDSDRHVIEPLEMWQQYVCPEVFRQFPVHFKTDTTDARQQRAKTLGAEAAIELPPVYMVADQPILNNWGIDLQIASAHIGPSSKEHRYAAMSGEGQLASMTQSNIGHAAIFSTFAGYIVNHEKLPTEVSTAYADAYNRWLKDYCAHSPERLIAVGLISRHDTETLVEQLHRIIDLGFTSITIRPEMIHQKTIGHSDYESFWQACNQHNIAVIFHGGTHLHAPTAGSDRFTSRFALHACSHPIEAQMAFVSLLESGVFERYPMLKFAFLEAGASWLPHWLWRLDNICYPEFQRLTQQNITMLPSEYFKRQCWIGIEIEEPCLREVANLIGHDKLLFGTDFPHPDHLNIDISDIHASCTGLTSDEIDDIVYTNAKALFREQA